jgi:hypothetical protein
MRIIFIFIEDGIIMVKQRMKIKMIFARSGNEHDDISVSLVAVSRFYMLHTVGAGIGFLAVVARQNLSKGNVSICVVGRDIFVFFRDSLLPIPR